MVNGGAARGGRRPPIPRKQAVKKRPEPPRPVERPVEVGPLVLGVIPGATPGKWVDAWKERLSRAPLDLVPLAVADQRRALVDGDVDAAIVRLPIEEDGLSIIRLYDEVPVAVVSIDSHLTAAEDLGLNDLGGEVVITPHDDVLAIEVPGAVAPRFPVPETTGDAIETVAAGVGVVLVPMSLARAHARKDVEYRVLRDTPGSTVALAWVTERTTPAVEAFIGIVRGRTANSSRR